MKTNYRLTVILLASSALVAAAVTGLRAQLKPPVYVVIDISEMTDPGTFGKALAASPPVAGDQFVIRTTKSVALDGGPPPARFVVHAFDSEEKARAWYNSPAIKEITAVRMKTAKSRAFMVEGVPN